MNQIDLPSTGSHDWQWLLASPGLHWKHGASAMALADAWEHSDDWPPQVAQTLAGDADLVDLEPLLALPEHKVPQPGGSASSQTDLFVLARRPDGDLVAVAVEGKAEEPFGDDVVSEWRADAGPGRTKRLPHLLDVLDLADDARLQPIRYQLLHRAASAVIEARRFGASHAVLLVHSFSPTDRWFDALAAFAALYGATATKGSTVRAGEARTGSNAPVVLHIGWVSDTPRPLDEPGRRFDLAFALAPELHAGQRRKGTDTPTRPPARGRVAGPRGRRRRGRGDRRAPARRGRGSGRSPDPEAHPRALRPTRG